MGTVLRFNFEIGQISILYWQQLAKRMGWYYGIPPAEETIFTHMVVICSVANDISWDIMTLEERLCAVWQMIIQFTYKTWKPCWTFVT